MIGINSNVLVRLLTKDDPAQAAQAEAFVARQFAECGPVFVNRIVLAEAVWVLQRLRNFDRRDIADAVRGILETESLRVEDAEAVSHAVDAYARGSIGLVDVIIARTNRNRGCEATATFDKRAAKHDGFVLLR